MVVVREGSCAEVVGSSQDPRLPVAVVRLCHLGTGGCRLFRSASVARPAGVWARSRNRGRSSDRSDPWHGTLAIGRGGKRSSLPPLDPYCGERRTLCPGWVRSGAPLLESARNLAFVRIGGIFEHSRRAVLPSVDVYDPQTGQSGPP